MTPSSRPSRTSANLSESVQQRLNAYALMASAAGVGILALAQPAQGKIVYTSANVRIGPPDRVQLDLNHDGVADFMFYRGGSFNHSTHVSWLAIAPLGPRGNAIRETGHGYNSAAALRTGVRVGNFRQISGNLMYMAYLKVRNSSTTFYGQWANGGKGVKNRYLGLKFIIKGKTHFGWARLNVTITKGQQRLFSGLLTGYAYETIPNKPIIAGKTKGADDMDDSSVRPNPASLNAPSGEPPALGLLAMGAHGLSIWRRELVDDLP